ncbi:uncharacterized protein LOC132757010 [Ruditapes philippinarum]|uniref:uncharacterized protein LOC132757010 n=1 Tax=Ruditapes philippinarum TaxID=129788 RepID=UPI00295C1BA0|nr:uncharacterized protein LOC132757010 [Ruditapes philippinarum]XP_060604165.1 uncharacterized protein LOC132757010 [Ruditapes philippinarum]
MSDSEQDVTLTVVSASLSCRFPSLVPNVTESTHDSNCTSLPADDVYESSKISSGSNNTVIDASTAGHEIIDFSGSDFENNTTFVRNAQNIEELSRKTLDENNIVYCPGNAIQNTTNAIEYELKHCVEKSSGGPRDSFNVVGTHDNHNKNDSNCITSETICTDSLIDKFLFTQICKNASERETKENRLTEDNFSGSTDGTLQNSEESSDHEESLLDNTQDSKRFSVRNHSNMGNKQAQAQKVQSDDDTPDDGRTKCCQVPKRKLKEKVNRSNRTSRNEDLNFDSNEVYPFEGRSRSEQEINEPVELEPFEIVETDDIKFVPGAGTSDVIKSISEPRFTTIAEEPSPSEEIQIPGISTETCPNVPFYIDKGNRLVEPGTATAHSTFEFKQAKPKTKLAKITSEQRQHNYENVTRIEESVEPNAALRKASSSSSKSNSSSSSKDISRKNSKDAMQKPSRKGKSKTSVDSADACLVEQDDRGNKPKKENEQKTQSIRDSEIDRKIDSVLMLTQTMFSQTKVTEDQDKDKSEPVALNQYENVGVCAKLEPSGIVIRHKDSNISDKPFQETAQNNKTCTGNNCEEPKEVNEVSRRRNHYSHLSKDIVEISDSGTLIIKSLADLPSERSTEEVEVEQRDEHSHSVSLSSDDIHDNTDLKVPYETIDRLSVENRIYTNDSISNVDDNDKLTENVPPPSPLAMEVLEEEEEDAFEEDDDTVDYGEDDRRKSEILEFTENVCKRLSHLLEAMSDEDNGTEDNATADSPERKRKNYEDHIYETIDGLSKLEKSRDHSDNKRSNSDNEKTKVRQQDKMSDFSCSLKCTSDELENSKNQQNPASDDDLPEYFDPRQLPPPEIFDDIASSEDDSLLSEEISNVVSAKTMSFQGFQYDNIVLENKDKNFSLPIQSFGNGLMNDATPLITTEDLRDITPTAEAHPRHTALPELAKAEEETPVQFDTSGRQSATCTESDIDVSEHRDDLSTDSMLADDEAEETMEILFTKTYTEPVEGAEVFLSCTVVNSAYKDERKKSETWLSDEALEYFEANASEVMSTAFLKAKKEMKDIQVCLQSLRQQMEHFHSDCDDISLPEIPVDSLSPDYFGIPMRKAVTD